MEWMSAASAFMTFAGFFFESDFEQIALERLSIQFGNSGAGFMTFHFKKAKPSALTGKEVFYEFDGTDLAELRKQGLQGFFGGGGWQTANK